MSDNENDGYVDFDSEEENKSLPKKSDIKDKDVNDKKEDENSEGDIDKETVVESDESIESLLDKDVDKNKDVDEDTIESLFDKEDTEEDEDNEDGPVYPSELINEAISYFETLKRYQKENKDLYKDINITAKDGTSISLSPIKNEKSDYKKFMSKLNLNNDIRIPLYNSGIILDVRECSMGDLISTYRGIQEEMSKSFNRSIFTYYFFADYLLIKEIKNFLSTCIVESCFEKEPNDIFDYISIHDIDIIITHIANLMFRDGFDDFELTCANEDCGHKEVISIRPESLIYTNFDKLNTSVKKYFAKFLSADEQLTMKIFNAVKEATYKDFKYTYVFEDDEFLIKSFYIEMQDVSVNTYLSLAQEYMNELNYNIEDIDVSIDLEMMKYNVTRHIVPHIDTLKIKNREFKLDKEGNKVKDKDGNYIEIDGEEFIIANEGDKIDFINIAINNSKDKEKVLDFFNDKIYGSKISHIFLPNTDCVKCKKPVFKEVEYIPIVPFAFFFMTLIKYINMRK